MDMLSFRDRRRLGRQMGWLAAAAIWLLPGAAGAAPESHSVDPLAGVEELAKPVTMHEAKLPLGELVQKVSDDTGVPLTAAPEVADEPIALAVTAMPARELLRQIAELLDYQWHIRRSGVRGAPPRSGGPGRSGVQNRTDRSNPSDRSDLRTPEHLNTRTPEHLNTVYEIYQDLASKQREAALREARLAAVVRRFQEELKQYEEVAALSPEEIQQLDDAAPAYWKSWWALPPEQQAARLKEPGAEEQQQRYEAAGSLRAPIPRALATLLRSISPEQWSRLLAGDVVTWSSDPGSGELRLPLEVERRLRGATPSWLPPGARLADPEPGAEEQLRRRDQALKEAWAAASGYRVTLHLDARQLQRQGSVLLYASATPFRNGAPLSADLPPTGPFLGPSLTIHSEANNPLSPLDDVTPGRQGALESDPVLGVKHGFKPSVQPQPGHGGPGAPAWWSLWDLLPDLARTYQVDFIADSYWSSTPGLSAVPREPIALHALLDQAAGRTHHWDREGKLIRLRSRTWYLDRPREIPLRLIRRWKELIAARGALPLDVWVELATRLADTQIDSLPRLIEIAGLSHDLFGAYLCRDVLRLYASLPPAQQATLRDGGTLPLSRMTSQQQALFLAALKSPVGAPAEALTPEHLAAASLSIKPVPLTRTLDRTTGETRESGAPAPAAPPAPEPGPGRREVEQLPVVQLQFRLAYGPDQSGGVALVTTPSL